MLLRAVKTTYTYIESDHEVERLFLSGSIGQYKFIH